MAVGTCHLTLEASPFQGASAEKFRLVDYKQRIELIYTRCLERVQGYNGGSVAIGEEKKFYAYLGAAYRKVGGWNKTIGTA